MKILNEIKSAVAEKDSDALRDALSLVNEQKYLVPILNQILLEDWHDSHEDIVLELGIMEDNSSTNQIALAATIPFQHLVEWNNLHEFQRKCAYALARIGTEESRKALKNLSQSSDNYLREYGLEGLQKWPLKRS